MFIPLIGVGLMRGERSLAWTEGSSAEDLVRRHVAGEMAAPARW